MMNLSTVVKQYLWAQGLSQKEFAEARGIPASSLGRFLRGTHALESKHLVSLLKWLMEEVA